MSIVTRTGDEGTTGLMYNRRVPKNHPRLEACGAVDELNAALGLARATAEQNFLRENLLSIQQHLVILMGELATLAPDLDRYAQDGFLKVSAAMTSGLETLIARIESKKIADPGWAMPGGTLCGAALDLARTTVRRAERRVCDLRQAGELHNPEIGVYLNRLSDLLWLMARWAERDPLPPASAGQVV